MEVEEHQESRINFIPCLKWVKKGIANTAPAKVQLTKDELVKIIKETQHKLRVENGGQEGENLSIQEGDEFNFDKYDEEDGTDTAELLGISALAELPQDQTEDNFTESDDSDKEDEIIKPTDNLILVGHVDGDASVLEVYVYNEQEESLYVHHDINLPSIPLCLEWLNYEANSPKGNYCAVGAMNPVIEVWDLDIINSVQPAFTLGKKASQKKNRAQIGHRDAVLAMAWNSGFEHILASGSVDKTIILWDMETKTPSSTVTAFSDKVQCLEWHRLEAQTLLAGGSDKVAKIFDCRTPKPHQTWQLDGEAERLIWNPLQPFVFLAGTSSGSVQCFDCRKGALWTLTVHSKEVTGLALSGQCPGLLLTASPDGFVKVWDINENEAKFVYERNFNLGYVHCLELCPDLPFVITVGGDNKENNFCVYDVQNIDVVKHTFERRELVQLFPENNSQQQES